MKFYYENILASENITAKPNLVWAADITEIEIHRNKKVYIFLCVDIHSNHIIAYNVSQNVITSKAIVNSLKKAITKRFTIIPRVKTIIHTDRGTQFSSQCYNNFTNQFKKFILPSMSRENTPTDNAVAERFMRTLKTHQIYGKTIEQALQEATLSDNILASKQYRKIVNSYVKSLNKKPNTKSIPKAPEIHDTRVSVASILMVEPLHPKAFSEHFGADYRRDEVYRYKAENRKVISLLEEFAAKKAEIVDQTPFDKLDKSLELEIIEKHLNEIYNLIKVNQLIIRDSVYEAIQPVDENIDSLREQLIEEMGVLNEKIDILLPKVKKDRQVEPLRDPIDNNLYPLFLVNAGNACQRKQDLRRAQLRITYTILYHCGMRINEIRHLKQNDLETAINAAQFSIIHHKTKTAHIHVLSKKAVQDLKNLKLEFEVVFDKYQYEYLLGKSKPITEKHFIDTVNKDLKYTCQKFKIPFNIKSHSFRINMITNLLKITSVQNTADIIGHSDIRSTMSYNRYALTKNEIQELLDKINRF